MREGLRCALMMNGVQCVMMDGGLQMPWWSADNLDMNHMVCNRIYRFQYIVTIMFLSLTLQGPSHFAMHTLVKEVGRYTLLTLAVVAVNNDSLTAHTVLPVTTTTVAIMRMLE